MESVMGNYQAGVAIRDTTPSQDLLSEGRIWLWGYGDRTEPCSGVADDVHQRLSTRALVLRDSGGSRVVLASIDIGALDPAMTARVKTRVAAANPSLSAEYICLNVSHTHCAPVGAEIPTWQLGVGHVDPAYGQFLEDQVVGVINDALSALVAANLAWVRGATQIGADRHLLSDQVDRHDPTLDVLRVTDPSGSVIAVVFATACHPVSDQDHTKVSADFPGVARALIEAKFGGVGLFLQGYAGNCIPFNGVPVEVVGSQLANDVINLLSGPMDVLSGPIDAWLTEVDLPLHPLDTATLPGWASLAQANSKNPTDSYALIGRWAAYMQSLGGDIPTTLATPLQAMRIGVSPAACYVVASGHEVVGEFAPTVRSLWPEPRVTVIGYSNAQLSYVPSAQLLQYPADASTVFPDATQPQMIANYEGGMAFLWYGHPGLLTTEVDNVFMQGHAELVDQACGPPQLVSLTISPDTVTTGDSATGVVTLSHPSFPAAVVDLLADSGFATVTSPIIIPQGKTSWPFTITTPPSILPFPPAHVDIQASYQGSFAAAVLTVKPRVVAGILSSLKVFPPTVTGGQSATGTVSLLEPVPTDTNVGLLALEPGSGPLGLEGARSDVASVPSQITIPAGSTTREFVITTKKIVSPGVRRGVIIQAGAVKTLSANLTVTH
jgi:neutral/alkaline ceramidase-like enzyme